MNWYKRASSQEFSLKLYIKLKEADSPTDTTDVQDILMSAADPQVIADIQTGLQIAEGRVRAEQGGVLTDAQSAVVQTVQQALSGQQNIDPGQTEEIGEISPLEQPDDPQILEGIPQP